MSNWETVRFDPTWEEKLDPEIIPLCDALNAAGFETTSSCYGHGNNWPHVWFRHDSDARVESLARYILREQRQDFRPSFTIFSKWIEDDGHQWMVEVHTNNVYSTTLREEARSAQISAINEAAALVSRWLVSVQYVRALWGSTK
jgi:hypothetical protein